MPALDKWCSKALQGLAVEDIELLREAWAMTGAEPMTKANTLVGHRDGFVWNVARRAYNLKAEPGDNFLDLAIRNQKPVNICNLIRGEFGCAASNVPDLPRR